MREPGMDRRRVRRVHVRAIAVVAALLAAAATSVQAGAAAPVRAGAVGDPLVVRTVDGVLSGAAAGSMDEYLGIPYAAPPVGSLRWEPPAPAAHWSGVRQATQFAPHCAQPATPFGIASTSEDCLYLNVYAPAGTSLRGGTLPVMVWIHGGSFVSGESDDFDPAPLVRRGVIVVTLNYRLGALGFLADSALADTPNGAAGNYGLMDQQAALRWVQANIARFGGDRRDVTLFGQSAGGISVLSQLVSPEARGLFSRAIVESGTPDLVQASLAAAESRGQAFAAKAGCADSTAAATAACLRALPVGTLLEDQATSYDPNIDGLVLPQSIESAVSTGRFNRVPVIDGTNRDEFSLFVALAELETGISVTAANYQEFIVGLFGVPAQAAAAIAAQYPVADYPSPQLALTAAGTDGIFACTALTADQDLSKYVPTYAYEFSDENAPQRFLPPVDFPYGAAHTDELQYLFDLTAPIPGTLTAAQQKLAAQMQGYWTDFAKFGLPEAVGQPLWPPFAGPAEPVLDLDTPRPAVETGFAAEHQCAFWAAAG
jgi:para-nitrobenzyl esterase